MPWVIGLGVLYFITVSGHFIVGVLNFEPFQWLILNTPLILLITSVYSFVFFSLFAHTQNITTGFKAPAIKLMEDFKKAERSDFMLAIIICSLISIFPAWVFYKGVSSGAHDFASLMVASMNQMQYESFSGIIIAGLFMISFFISIPIFFISLYVIFMLFLTIPFCLFSIIIYLHYSLISHPLSGYVKSNKPIPASVMEKVANMGGRVGVGAVMPAFVYENYRIKTEKILNKIRQRRENLKRVEQVKHDGKLRKTQQEINRIDAKRRVEEMNLVKQKASEEKKKFGTKEQQERRAAFNKAQSDLINEFVEKD